ncbi:MAG TPA: hypothetical protein VFL70_09175 [Bacteroidia bacterium]|nr:hypothetical protein [Bacteroidia bacterium]
MATNWDDIANQAANATDTHFASQISGLTRLNDKEIESLISETGINKQDLVLVLKEVKDAQKSNEAKAKAIKNIGKGLDVLVSIAGKFI